MVDSIKYNYDLPIRGRGPEHYLRVFPEVFPVTPDQRVLVVGSGLSNITLTPGVIGLDPKFNSINRMQSQFLRDRYSSAETASAVNTILHMAHIRSKEIQNSHLVAGQASPDFQLPFAYHCFTNIVSSNCIFEGLDYIYPPDKLTKLITRVFKHITPGGSLYLFPYYTQDPWSIAWEDRHEQDIEFYSQAFYTQQQVINNLSDLGYDLTSQITRIRGDKLPTVLHTLKIGT